MPLWSNTNASHALKLTGRIKYSVHCPIVSASVKPIYFFYFSAGENNRVCHLDFGRQRQCPLHVVSLQGLALCADSGMCYCRSVSYQICRDCELACLVLGNRTDKQNKLVCAICGVLGKIVAHIRVNHIKDDVIVIGKKNYTLIIS